MNQAKYPSKERVVRDDVLVYAEGDDLINDLDEARRQGYKVSADDTADASAQTADDPAPKKRTSRKSSKKS